MALGSGGEDFGPAESLLRSHIHDSTEPLVQAYVYASGITIHGRSCTKTISGSEDNIALKNEL